MKIKVQTILNFYLVTTTVNIFCWSLGGILGFFFVFTYIRILSVLICHVSIFIKLFKMKCLLVQLDKKTKLL